MIESNREIKKPSEKREIMPRFEASALRGYCVSVLTASGVERSCAEAVADALIDAELTGVSTHGVSRLAVYMQRMDAGVMSRENNIRIVRESTSTLVVDAGNSLGAAAAKFAMERCIAKAKETGCCFASVHSSNHFGTAAYYTRLAAAQDMIGFACTNLKGKIAPFGSAEPYMGTNPISVAAPSDDLPVVLDMAPSVVALGKLILAQKLGKSIPEGWALDKDGRPTTDPAAGRAGSLVPIGGAKGSGLAIMVDVLCGILSGGPYGPHLHDLYVMDEPQGVSHFLGAIDIAHFIEPAAFKSALSAMSREIKALKKAAEDDRFADLKNKFEQVEAELKDDTQTNLETYRTQVVETINNDIVMRHGYQAGVIEHSLSGDKEVKKAVEVLGDPAEYARITREQDTKRK